MKLIVSTLLAGLVMSAGACKKDGPPPAAEPAATPAPATPETPTAPPVIGEVAPAVPLGEPAAKPDEPAAIEPAPAEPAPAEPAEPAEPAAVDEPAPTEPEPVDPDAAEPAEPTDQPPGDDEATAPGVKMHDIQLADAAITNEIVDRLPSERRDSWVIGQDASLLIWMEFENKIEEVTLETVWKKDGEEKWRFPFQVGKSPHWRTWVTKRIGKRDAGSWTVEVIDEGGFVYHSSAFTIAGE